jgi:uncharacterized damage-inducible protein DinB
MRDDRDIAKVHGSNPLGIGARLPRPAPAVQQFRSALQKHARSGNLWATEEGRAMQSAENPWTRMALNNAWANATLYSTLCALPEKVFVAPRPGFFPSLSATMNHIHAVDLYYLDALENGGLGRRVFDRAETDDPTGLGAEQAETDMRLASFCQDVTPGILQETRLTDRDPGAVAENVASILLHLFQHQIHHRGQAHVQLSHAGVNPPQLDDFHLNFGRAPSAAAYFDT